MLSQKSELDLFTGRPIQNDIKSNRTVGYKTTTSLDNASQLEFFCPADTENFRDLASIYLWLKFKVVKLSGEDFVETDANQPGCVNYLVNSLFSEINISLNETTITKNADNYPYRAYIEALLNYSEDTAKTHLTNAMFYLDTYGANGSLSATDANSGFKKRAATLRNSKTVEIMGRIHVDLFNSSKLMLNNVSMRVKLNRASPEFYMFSKSNDVTGKIKILDATLFVKQVEINPTLSLKIEKKLLETPASYHIQRVEVKNNTVGTGANSINIPYLLQGQIPKYIIFGLVKNDSFVGSFESNPFQFIHSDLVNIALFVKGVGVNDPIQCDFRHIELTALAYQTLFTGTGIYHQNQPHLITKDLFYHGYTLFAYDLTPDSAGIEAHSSLPQNGTIRLELRFAAGLTTPLSCIVYAVYDETITIDSTRNVSLMY